MSNHRRPHALARPRSQRSVTTTTTTSSPVIDLCGSPELARPATAPEVIQLLDDDDDDDDDILLPQRSPPRQRSFARKRHRAEPRGTRHAVVVQEHAGVARRPRPPETPSQTSALADRRRGKTDPNERSATKRAKRRQAPSPRTQHCRAGAFEEVQIVQCKPAPPQATPVQQILEVFPDADVHELQRTLAQNFHNVAMVLTLMTERPYKKAEVAPVRTPAGHMEHGRRYRYNYMSTDSFQASREYRASAYNQLLYEFGFLSVKAVNFLLERYKYHYAMCHDKILACVRGTGEEPTQYNRVLHMQAGQALDATQIEALRVAGSVRGVICLKNPRRNTPKPVVVDPILREEIGYVQCKWKEWREAQEERRQRECRQDQAQKAGTAVDCSCCFDSYPKLDMVACKQKGHLFCVDCLKRFAENQIFGQGNLGIDKQTKQPALELTCFHGDGCTSGFHRSCLEVALPPKAIQKYDELQFQICIDRAGLQDVCACPRCNFKADVPPEQKVFECPQPDCRFVSCRECGQASHIPLRCEEVKKETVETKGRLTVEEAMTAAMVRTCPSCKKGVIKSEGCNKISCACGIKFCYMCQTKITDYSHFCQIPHCTHGPQSQCRGSRCALYTNAAQDDATATRRAGLQAAQQVQQHAAGTLQQDVRIDVEGLWRAR